MFEGAEEADCRLRAEFQKTLDQGHTSKGMWAFRKPYTIRFGRVYGDGWKRCLAMDGVSEAQREDLPCFWCLYSDYYDKTEPVPWAYVLCEPLIENGCRTPWPTHLSRLKPVCFVPVVVETPGPTIEELSDDELRMWDSEEASSDAGQDDGDVWASYQRGLWEKCQCWHAYVAWRQAEDWSREEPNHDEDDWAGYASIHSDDLWHQRHGDSRDDEDWLQQWPGEDDADARAGDAAVDDKDWWQEAVGEHLWQEWWQEGHGGDWWQEPQEGHDEDWWLGGPGAEWWQEGRDQYQGQRWR